MHISPITLNDLPRIPTIQPADWEDITPFFDYYVRSAHCEAWKGELDGKLAAVGAIIFHKHTAWLAHILVHEDQRRQGLGGQITQALVDRIPRATYPSILLIATEMGEPVYKRLGFAVECHSAAFRYEADAFLPPDSENVNAYSPEWEQRVLELDTWVSGEQRADTLTPHLPKAQLITQGAALLGAYLPTLGDGLILARDAAAGKQLLDVRLPDTSFAIVPEANEEAVSHLISRGLEPVKRISRMFLGEPHTWRPEGLYHRIGGNLG